MHLLYIDHTGDGGRFAVPDRSVAPDGLIIQGVVRP